MERHGVGRPAVREALLTLQKAGLIATQNGERARVVRPSASSLVGELGSAARYLLSREGGVRQFQQARLLFETALVRSAAVTASEDDIGRLAKALAANAAALADPDAFAVTDVAFHFVFAEITRNSIFVALHVALAEWLTEQRAASLQRRGTARKALKAHRIIFDAVAAHDPDAAEAAMRGHLIDIEETYWSVRSGQTR